MKVCYLVERLGPYHAARLNLAAQGGELTVIELDPDSTTYAWDRVDFGAVRFQRVAVRPSLGQRFDTALETALVDAEPATVFLNGWADRGALTALRWCLKHRIAPVVMSDSQRHDERRVWWKELVKRGVLTGCQGAFVAGRRHAEYLRVLGFGKRPVTQGYDVVDNAYFQAGAATARADVAATRARLKLPERYFLCVSRLIAKKNLPLLLRAFGNYRRQAGRAGWDLVILGDGEERGTLEAQIARDGLSEAVHLRGFFQYDALPACYGLAGAFVLASTTEQWGLAVNEAMASGLPVLVSRVCGCAPELVVEGVNGFTFDPDDEGRLTSLLTRVAAPECDRQAMGEASRRIVGDWPLDRFAEGFWSAARLAHNPESKGILNVVRAVFSRLAVTLLLRKI